MRPPFRLRDSEWCLISSLRVKECSSDKQRLWPDCAYAQADLRLCWSLIPHCWKPHVAAHMYIEYWLYSNPVLSGRSERKTNYLLMQAKSIAECFKPSAMLLTFIKLPSVIGVFSLSFLGGCLKTSFAVSNTYMYFLFCGVQIYLIVLFTQQKWMVHWAHCLVKWWAIFWNHGTMTWAHRGSEDNQQSLNYQPIEKTVWILISWLHQKSTNLALYCFEMRILK